MDDNRPNGESVGETEDDVTTADPAAQLAEIAAERDRLAAEKADLYDRLLRRQAEFDNFRKRAERERLDTLEYAEMEAIRKLLPVLDDFDRALRIESADKEYSKGIELIYQRFVDTLKRMGVEPLESTGKPFDPNLHHAIESVPTEEVADHTVLEEMQRGYNFRGKLLRPAMVRVAVRP